MKSNPESTTSHHKVSLAKDAVFGIVVSTGVGLAVAAILMVLVITLAH